MRALRSVLTLGLICITLCLAFEPRAEEGSNDDTVNPVPVFRDDILYELGIFADAVTLIDANYVRKVSPKELISSALDGMVSSLDSHSEFLSYEQHMKLQADSMGEFGGLGIKVAIRDKVLTVISPLEATPAQKSGILPGDRIIKINDKTTEGFGLDDAVDLLRGRPGTLVKLTIVRGPERDIKEFTLKRAIIKVQSVRYSLIAGEDIGYIRIADFQRHTPSDLNKAMRYFIKNRIKALILDLRGNPGGLMEASIMVCERFIKKPGVIVSTKGRFEGQNAVFRSRASRVYEGFPVAVIINEGSASASEIVAAALRDNKRAVIVGSKSFGKGSVQTVMPLKDNSAVRLTTSYYYTPSGRIIHEKGILPDIITPREEAVLGTDNEEEAKEVLTPEQVLLRDADILESINLLNDRGRYESLLLGYPLETGGSG
ncbi:MAG: S41 family peptidase [Candidatus Omnitrophota bacterium]